VTYNEMDSMNGPNTQRGEDPGNQYLQTKVAPLSLKGQGRDECHGPQQVEDWELCCICEDSHCQKSNEAGEKQGINIPVLLPAVLRSLLVPPIGKTQLLSGPNPESKVKEPS
jgi:hypothetical protein